jgi:hypothetical protein
MLICSTLHIIDKVVIILTHHYGYLLKVLSGCMKASMDNALASMDLTSAQGHIMGYLAQRSQPPCSRDIEETFHLSHPTVSGLLSRLEKKEKLGLFDYYTLGKLIHYTTDAFTYAHNDTFPTALSDHREYEAALQDHFLEYMKQDPKVNPKIAGSVMEAIYSYHREYEAQAANIYTDTRFALNACCCVLAVLLTNPIF